jgi:hypothetical protein
MTISCGFKIPQETITYEGLSWEPESAGNSAGNVSYGFFVQIRRKIRRKTVNF